MDLLVVPKADAKPGRAALLFWDWPAPGAQYSWNCPGSTGPSKVALTVNPVLATYPGCAKVKFLPLPCTQRQGFTMLTLLYDPFIECHCVQKLNDPPCPASRPSTDLMSVILPAYSVLQLRIGWPTMDRCLGPRCVPP